MIGSSATVVRRHIRVTGVVQGVGFRPHVHRLAGALGLSGTVGNDACGVFVEVEGSVDAVDELLRRLVDEAPPLAIVDRVEHRDVPCRGDPGFTIAPSGGGIPITFVAPDAAVCDQCLEELFDPSDRRYRYPFITCTNCGPRFTITTDLPYDRRNTTMADFALCPACATQYGDPADRRFHAQPLACADCGPHVWLDRDNGERAVGDEAIADAHALLAAGGVVAVKGLGGYHLACSATSTVATEDLRRRKGRAAKPFAVMVADLDAARRLAVVDDAEAALLTSAARPIVLVRARTDSTLSPAVAPGSPLVGIMIPYTPVHHLLFAAVPNSSTPPPTAIVLTSGNRAEEPICHDDVDARDRLDGLADAFLTHDRPIHVPCDDSVVRVVDGTTLPIRRSRGYAPLPVKLPFATPPLLAVGGELKNTFCVARGRDAWLSQHIGDMGSVETLHAFDRSIARLCRLYEIEPSAVVADAHPGYHSRQWAERSDAARLVTVQHHHAHLAAVCAEHGVAVDTDVIGVTFDGTGYGPDSSIWGGEILVGGYARVRRAAHLRPVLLAGGDATVERPYRSALSHLADAGIAWTDDLAPVAAARSGELGVLARQFERNVHCVSTTSMGRLFDAVSSLLGVRQVVTYEAQAAIELEILADTATDPAAYEFAVTADVIDQRPVLRAIVEDVRRCRPAADIAAGFHRAVADATTTVAATIGAAAAIDTVALTGGVFQNALLTRLTRVGLQRHGFTVLTHTLVPPNDGGLALGQVAVAAARLADDFDEEN